MIIVKLIMATAEELQKQIEELTKKLKESEDVKKKNTVYTMEKKFSCLTLDTDVLDWFEYMKSYRKHSNPYNLPRSAVKQSVSVAPGYSEYADAINFLGATIFENLV